MNEVFEKIDMNRSFNKKLVSPSIYQVPKNIKITSYLDKEDNLENKAHSHAILNKDREVIALNL